MVEGDLVESTWENMIEAVKDSIAKYFSSVNEQAPFLGYLGAAFWSAWILATSGVQDWVSSSFGAESALSATYVETRTVAIAALVLFAFLGHKTTKLLESKRIMLLASLAAVAGNVLLASSWLPSTVSTTLLHTGSLLSGCGMAFLLIKTGLLYSTLSPWRAMLLFMVSQMIAACLYLVITVAPTEASTVAFCSLPLAAAVTFALVPKSFRGKRRVSESRGAIDGFARLVLMIFAFRLCSNYVKTLLAASQTSDSIELGVVGNILLKMLVAFAFICYAFNASKKVDYGRVCYFLFVGSTMTLAVIPLFKDQAPLFYALSGTLSGLTGSIAFCIFAYICFQSKASPTRAFGFGYAAVLLGSLLGQVLGGQAGMLISHESLSSAPFLAAAYALILLALLAFSPRQLDKLAAPEKYEDALDLTKKREAADAETFTARYDIVARKYRLTDREREVLELLASGHGRAYAANRLHVSINTVRSHSRSIYTKLDVHSHAELMTVLDRTETRPSG